MPKQRNEVESYSRNQGFEFRAEYSSGNVIYEGWAGLTSFTISDSDAIFQICKHTYDGSNNLIKTQWANNTDDFKFAWSLRAKYF